MDSEYIGIIGAVVGSLSTLIATEVIKHVGRTKIYLTDCYGRFYNCESANYIGENPSDLHQFNFTYTLEIYNGCDLPKIFRDFKVCFYKNNKMILKQYPNDEFTKECSSYMVKIDSAKAFNINPKKITTVKQSICVSRDEIHKIVGCDRIELRYKNAGKLNKKIILYKGCLEYDPNSPNCIKL